MLSAYKKSNDPQEKLAILENLLSGTTQIICDIYSRFLFEDAVFHKCEAQFLMTNMETKRRLCLMLRSRHMEMVLIRQSFIHICGLARVTTITSGLSYYNFPYAFGGLFAMGLYTQVFK